MTYFCLEQSAIQEAFMYICSFHKHETTDHVPGGLSFGTSPLVNIIVARIQSHSSAGQGECTV